MTATSAPRLSASPAVSPMDATSGRVKIVHGTVVRSSCTVEAPRAWKAAWRPCIDAVEASIMPPARSPTAYTPSAFVCRLPSTITAPRSSVVMPQHLEAQAG